jgi:type IV secretory pathway VirB10-like protein
MRPSLGVHNQLRAAGALVFGVGATLIPLASLEQAPTTQIESTLSADDMPELSPLQSEVLGNVAVGFCNTKLLGEPLTVDCVPHNAAVFDGPPLPTPTAPNKVQPVPSAHAQVTTTTEAPTTTTTEAPTTTTTTLSAAAPNAANNTGVTAAQIAAWDKVNICEEGGRWNVDGSEYSGGLGFSHANWKQFNTFGYAADAADATPDEQIRVAVAFATEYLGGPNVAPDQNGCDGGY